MAKYRVWIEQVNQTYFDVSANSEVAAGEKAYKEWCRENRECPPRITDIAKIGKPK